MKFIEIYRNDEKKFSVCSIEESNNLFALKIDNMIENGTAYFYITPKEANLHKENEESREKLSQLATRLKINIPANRFIYAKTEKKVTPMTAPMNNDDEYIEYRKKHIFTNEDMTNGIITPEKMDGAVLQKMTVNNISAAIIALNGLPEEIRSTPSHKGKINTLVPLLYVKIKTSECIYVAFDNNGDFYINSENQLYFFSKSEFAYGAKEHFRGDGIEFEIERVESKDFHDLFKKLENVKDKKIVLDIGFNPLVISPSDFILPDIPTDKESYSELNIDDIINYQKKAKSVLPVTKDSKKVYDFVSIQLAKKLSENTIYVIYDKSIDEKFPYIDANGFAWVFSSEEYAKDALEHYKEKLSLSVKEIEKKHIPTYMLYLREQGIEMFRLNNGHNMTEISRECFLPGITDLRKISLRYSPQLVYNAVRFLQANNHADESSKLISKMTMPIMCKFVSDCVYLVPVALKNGAKEKTVYYNEMYESYIKKRINTGAFNLEKASEEYEFRFLKRSGSEKLFIPLFTGLSQLSSVYRENDFSLYAVTFEEVEKLVNDEKNAVIDCNGINIILSRKSIEEIKNVSSIVVEKKQ